MLISCYTSQTLHLSIPALFSETHPKINDSLMGFTICHLPSTYQVFVMNCLPFSGWPLRWPLGSTKSRKAFIYQCVNVGVERHEPLTLLAAETSGNKKITSFNADSNVKHFWPRSNGGRSSTLQRMAGKSPNCWYSALQRMSAIVRLSKTFNNHRGFERGFWNARRQLRPMAGECP